MAGIEVLFCLRTCFMRFWGIQKGNVSIKQAKISDSKTHEKSEIRLLEEKSSTNDYSQFLETLCTFRQYTFG